MLPAGNWHHSTPVRSPPASESASRSGLFKGRHWREAAGVEPPVDTSDSALCECLCDFGVAQPLTLGGGHLVEQPFQPFVVAPCPDVQVLPLLSGGPALNRLLLVVRSRANKSIELSRGVGAAPAYGESKSFLGVDQVKKMMVSAHDRANVESNPRSGEVLWLVGGS